MSDVNDRKSPERRLRFFRFGLLAITAVVYAMALTFGWITELGNWPRALLQGFIYLACAAVLSVIIYFLYKKFVVKAE